MSQPIDTLTSDTIALATESLRASGQLRLRVTGGSMLPALRPGDVLQFEACTAEQTQSGDIVLFSREGRLVVHRVVTRTKSGLITQGDGLAQPDPPVDRADVLGKVVGIKRHGHHLPHHRRAGVSLHLTRWLFGRSAMATRLFLRWQRRSLRKAA